MKKYLEKETTSFELEKKNGVEKYHGERKIVAD